MQITLLAQPDIIETALDIAESAPPFSGLKMQAPTGDLLGRFEKIWDDVRKGINQIYLRGKQQVGEVVAVVRAQIETQLAAAGAQAEELRKLLLDRLARYLQGLVDTMLLAVRSSLTVAGRSMPLTSLEVSQTYSVSNSLELSLTRVFEFTAGGELSVSASYAVEGKGSK